MIKDDLESLLSIHTLQTMQDTFSQYTGISLYITDEQGRMIAQVSKGSGFCANCIMTNHIGGKFCEYCVMDGMRLAQTEQKAITYTCHAGLMECVVPIMLEQKCIGYLIGGQVKSENLNERFDKKIAIKYGIDYETYKAALNEVGQMNLAKFESLAKSLEHVADQIALLISKQDSKKTTIKGCQIYSEINRVISA